MHARPQPLAGPSSATRTPPRDAQRARSRPSPEQPKRIQTLLTEALKHPNIAQARNLLATISHERLALSSSEQKGIERAWARYHARKRKQDDVLLARRVKLGAPAPTPTRASASKQRLPRYLQTSLASGSTTELDADTALDLIHHSLRSNPPHPTLESLIRAFPQINPRRILHQFLHPDLARPHPVPIPSLKTLGITPTTTTLHLYLRNLERKIHAARRSQRLILKFSKIRVEPDIECWWLLYRFVKRENDSAVARWVLELRDGLQLDKGRLRRLFQEIAQAEDSKKD